MANDLTVRDPQQQRVSFYTPTTLADLLAFADHLSQSQVVPKAFQGKPADIVAAVQMGAEDGLPPMAALRNIAVINGKPAYYGDATPGIAMSKGYITDIDDRIEGEGEQRAAVVTVTKRNGQTLTRRFSVADAKRAGLIGKGGPWTQYQDRMLFMRARSWAIRDAAPHAQFGPAVEELQHIGPDNAREINPLPSHDPRTGEVRDPLERYEARQQPEPEDASQEAPDLVPLWIKDGREDQVALDEAAAKVVQMISAARSTDRVNAVWSHNFPLFGQMTEAQRDSIEATYNDALAALEDQGELV